MRNVNSLSDIETKIKNGQLPAILSEDTSTAGDIWGFIKKMPDNMFWAFYDPSRIDADDLGRLTDKAMRRFYQPSLTAIRWTAWMNPRLRTDGVNALRNMDLDSFKYIEPVLHGADEITLRLMESLFDTEEDGAASIADNAIMLSQQIQELAKAFERQGANNANQRQYNEMLERLYNLQSVSREQIRVLSDQLDEALLQLDNMKVPGGDKSLKRARVKALRAHLIRVKKQGVDLYRHIEKSSKDMKELADSDQYTPSEFATRLKDIGFTMDARVKRTTEMAQDLADMSFTRRTRKLRERQNGQIIRSTKNAGVEHYRKLKLAVDMGFVPDESCTLGTIDSDTLGHNAENYFATVVDYGLNNVFDENGNYKTLGQRTTNYGQDMGQHMAQLYAMGKPEDALYAISLLKMSEGKESYQVFPDAFQNIVKKQMAAHYGVSEAEIESSKHAQMFLERVRDISSSRDHSPLVYGPRDTAARYIKRVRQLIYGRMYPSTDGYIATPLHQIAIQHPLIRLREGLKAYVTGGRVVSLQELNRVAKPHNVLESEMGLAVKRGWWWAPKEEKTKENPNPPNFFERAPWWFNMPRRAALLASLPASIALLKGSLTAGMIATSLPALAPAIALAPWLVTGPIMALGAVAAANYTLKAAKSAWKMSFVRKPMVFALKAAAIGGAAYLALPLMPAVGAWALATAAAHPLWAGLIAAPFAMKAVSTISKIGRPNPNADVSFGDFRAEEQIADDPLDLVDEHGEFLTLSPNAPEPVTIELKNPEPSMEHTDYRPLVEEFIRRMETRDTEFLGRMQDLFAQAGRDRKSVV